METQVYLVRHGETLWNREQRLQGQLDSPLTENGILQAEELARYLDHHFFDTIFSSDLERAAHTARIIASHKQGDHRIIMDERIRERHFGNFQGLTWKEVTERFPNDAAKEVAGNPMNVIPGGESKHQLLLRVKVFFEELVKLHEGKKILVISHGGVVNVWTRQVLKIPFDVPRRFYLGNSSISIFNHSDDGWYVRTLGYTPDLN